MDSVQGRPPLTDIEVRVLGSLVEKEAATPDNYPLSLNSLVAACNQSTNRDPVMRLDESAVQEAAVALRRRGLLRQITPVGSRVTKFEHLLADELKIGARQLALLGVLMLRGPQTAGELHTRSTRLEHFADIGEVEAALESLIAREPEPLVARLARRPGQKEVRYAHLLSGAEAAERALAAIPPAAVVAAHAGGGRRSTADEDRVAALERALEELRADLAAIRTELAEFRAQFQ